MARGSPRRYGEKAPALPSVMTLQQLRYFLATCQHGSFAAAADALYLAQPSVAEQIRRLEQELGVRLFFRTGRRLELTDPGRQLQSHALRAMTAIEAAESAMKKSRTLQGGAASIGTFLLWERYLVEGPISQFAARHPDVSLRVVANRSEGIVQAVRSGELEVGLVALPIDDTALEVEAVWRDEILFTALPGPDTAAPMTVARLNETRLVAWPASTGWADPLRAQLQEWATVEGGDLQAAIEVESLESALELACAGLGATYVLRMFAEAATWRGQLEAVSFEPPVFHTCAVIWRRGHTLSPATAELIRLTRQHMAPYGRNLN
jgi:DNA-binding transcriptional LysR family regulator